LFCFFASKKLQSFVVEREKRRESVLFRKKEKSFFFKEETNGERTKSERKNVCVS